MFYPDLELFRKKAGEGNLIPVYTEIIADLETPLSAFLKLGESPYSFLLESTEPGHQIGRYSFLGANPFLIFKSRGEEVEIIEEGVSGFVMDDLHDRMYVTTGKENQANLYAFTLDGTLVWSSADWGTEAFDSVRGREWYQYWNRQGRASEKS
jgi:anthranilate/para-aminobenzoate synthase component I